jgi:type I restriction enzyme S subunit
MSEIPKGYKQTEIGIIPEDWEVKKLGEVFEISAGGDLNKNKFSETKTSKHKYPIYSNAVENEGLYGYSTDYKYPESCITVTARGTLGYAIPRYEKFNAIIRLLVLQSKKELNIKYVAEYINNMINFSIESTGVPQLTAPQISKYKLLLPPLPEQQAIAKVLSDIDKLIESIDKLIEKKKLIKKGAMQQLLTGKKRLPGFKGEWVRKKLGEIATVKTGTRNNQDKVENGKYPFFVRSDKIERIDTYSYDEEAIIVPGEGRIGEIFHYINGKFEAHQRVYVIRNLHKDVYAKYLYYYIYEFFGKHALKNTVKATVDSLRLPTFLTFEILMPSNIKEQQAIAKILSDMDAEIEALQKKKEKYEQIKKGVMQQLLTGRIRLKF